MPVLCRDCLASFRPGASVGRCRRCGSARIIGHPELNALTIAHIDCDAFYASVEKRDNPDLAERPVVVGGRRRGVVMAACYVARGYGIRSAMPMYKALRACPEAVVVRPDMEKYERVSRALRALLEGVTPLVEPLSIDEAFLDLSGTERLHGRSAAATVAALASRIERELGITVSVGLSDNKFLAKVASNLDKPRGFAVIGRAEAPDFLRPRPVSLLWGVGRSLQRKLADDGVTTIGQLRDLDERELVARYGRIGRRLARFARGEDDRRVDPHGPRKSISAETTFDRDVREPRDLETALWPLCERVSARLKRSGLAGRGVVLKLKTARFQARTRSRRLAAPTQLAEIIFETARALLEREADGTLYRLIGVGVEGVAPGAEADPPELFDQARERLVRTERAVDDVREKFGAGAIGKGRGFAPRRGRSAARPIVLRADTD